MFNNVMFKCFSTMFSLGAPVNFLGKEPVCFPITDEHSSLAVFTKSSRNLPD